MNQKPNQVPLLREPPVGLLTTARCLGPGFILSAAIVGSGELIATTALGAKAGFTLLWAILLGCLIKVAVQLEYGRYCILRGKPSFRAWDEGRSGRIWGLHWSIWIAFLFIVSMFIGLAGVMGAAAQVGHSVLPEISLNMWVLLLVIAIAIPVFQGKYRIVEVAATVFNLVFVGAVAYCVFAVQKTEYAFSLGDLTEGLNFVIPPGSLALAIGAFGITGVGAAEIFTYPYWCLEKGYARWTGAADGSSDWARRAKGWIRVMTIDAFAALVVYTWTTCAFYILGASILRVQERLADGNQLIDQLSVIFTEVLGPEAWVIFMVGAFAVLFSTVFSNAAGYSRLWADFFAVTGVIQPESAQQRRRTIAVMAWLLPIVWGLVYLGFQKPLILVIFMGISNSLFLLVVAYKAIVFHYSGPDRRMFSSLRYDVFLWVSVLSIVLLSFWALYESVAANS
jgi:Mn2+/Fe2+ NRAMP family transporter